MAPKLIEEKTFDYAIVTDADGLIIHNALQQDDCIIRRKYDDGVIVMRGETSGRMIGRPYRVGPRGEYLPVDDTWEEPVPTTVCKCCKRPITQDTPEGTCWECRGRPALSTGTRAVRIPGERAESCPHAMPQEIK